MAGKPGHKRLNFNIPEKEVETLGKRADADGSNMSKIINEDIVRGNRAFKKSQ